jgi:hypothetical protein
MRSRAWRVTTIQRWNLMLNMASMLCHSSHVDKKTALAGRRSWVTEI